MNLDETLALMDRIERNMVKPQYRGAVEVREAMIGKYRELYHHATTKLGLKHPDDRYGKATNWLSMHERSGPL